MAILHGAVNEPPRLASTALRVKKIEKTNVLSSLPWRLSAGSSYGCERAALSHHPTRTASTGPVLGRCGKFSWVGVDANFNFEFILLILIYI
jgi:hypothetical protein